MSNAKAVKNLRPHPEERAPKSGVPDVCTQEAFDTRSAVIARLDRAIQ